MGNHCLVLRVSVLLAVQALVLVGCASADVGHESTPSESVVAGSTDRSAVFPSATSLRLDGPTSITGTLSFDSVEGGCATLQSGDGTRYEVIYPNGWRMDRATGHLLGPDGQDVGPGAVITVRGSIATDMASICQIGPIFRAAEVVPG